MAQRLLTPNPENASLLELKELARVGSSETALRCTAIQMLIVGTGREQVCQALLVTDRAVRKWINAFNRRGVDGLIANKRPGPTALIGAETAEELTTIVEHPVQAGRTFWTAKAFHGYISEAYQIECSYETVLRFFHRQGYALKVPQPWPDRKDEAERECFRQKLKELLRNQRWTSGLPMNPALMGIPGRGGDGTSRVERPAPPKTGITCA